ncbi:MAG TPA: TIGR00366 family protein [Syntrophobacteria bacterium]|nr:TIGR00366 family protein [Syntrophobacteria bacterium]
MIRSMASVLTSLMRNYFPSTFVFAVLLTSLSMVLALLFTGAALSVVLESWASGFFNILTFAMQIILILVTGHALALSPPAERLLDGIAGRGRTPVRGVMLVMFVGITGSLINWAFGLFFAGLLALEVAKRTPRADYPLLVAAAYSGQICWHQGLSGFIPLVLATPDHPQNFAYQLTGISVPLSQTIFQPYSFVPVLLLVVSLPFLMALIHPRGDGITEISPEVVQVLSGEKILQEKLRNVTWSEKIDHSALVSALFVVIGVAYLSFHFYRKGPDLNVNIIILILFVLGVMLHGRPVHYVRAAGIAIRGAGGIAVQFPLYGGIMGILSGTGLASIIAGWFVALSTPKTAYLMQFLGTGLINMFVPSGGGQWAIQGPITLEAVRLIGLDTPRSAMMVAWGNQWTNMIQPFWALPLLGLAGLTAKDILGYTAMTFLWSGVVFATFALLIGYHIL